MSTRLMPYNEQAEVGILAGCLILTEEIIDNCLEKLKSDHFYRSPHKVIFEVLRSMRVARKPIDQITVTNELQSVLKLEEIGGHHYISSLTCSFPTTSHIDYYITVLEENFKLRKLIEIGSSLIENSFEKRDSLDLISETENQISYLMDECENGQDNKTELASDELKRMIEVRRSGEKVTGLSTGISVFDNIFAGLQKTQYYVIAGRPSSGKSALADQIAINVVMRDKPVLYIALEGSTERVFSKIACKMADVCFSDFSRNSISIEDLNRVEKCGNILKEKPLILVRPPSMDAIELKSVVRRYSRKFDLSLMILDFIQKVNIPKGWDERRGISDASHTFQNLCVETGAPGIALAQLNRDSEKEARPRMRHLKESGDIEQDADNVLILWSKKDPKDLMPGQPQEITFSIEKNKDGMKDLDEEMIFNGRLMKFNNVKRI